MMNHSLETNEDAVLRIPSQNYIQRGNTSQQQQSNGNISDNEFDESSSASYFAAFQNQAIRTSFEDVVELAFRVRKLKIHRPTYRKRNSKNPSSNIQHHISNFTSTIASSTASLAAAVVSVTTTTTTTVTTTINGNNNNNTAQSLNSTSSVSEDEPNLFINSQSLQQSPPPQSLFSRVSSKVKGNAKPKDTTSLTPTLSMIKVFALPKSNINLDGVDAPKFREIHRSEIQGQSETPVFSSLSVLPISTDLINDIYDKLAVPANAAPNESFESEFDVLLRFQLWVSVDHGTLVHFGTAFKSLSGILRDCGFVPPKDQYSRQQTSGSSSGSTLRRRTSAMQAISNLTKWRKGSENDAERSRVGWCTLNFVPELGNGSNEPVILDIRVSRPSRLLSVHLPTRFDELPSVPMSIGPHGSLLRSRPPLPPSMLRGFINAPLSRGFQFPISDPSDEKASSSAASDGGQPSRFIEFREELAEMPMNLLIPALFVEVAAAQLEVKRMYLQFRFDVEKTEILNNSNFVNHEEFTSLIIKHEKWITTTLENIKTRIQKMTASSNEYKRLWRKCVGIETLKGHPRTQTHGGQGVVRPVSTAMMVPTSAHHKNDSQYSLFMGSEISSQVSSFNISHVDSVSLVEQSTPPNESASLSNLDLSSTIEEEDDGPSPEDALLMKKILGSNQHEQTLFFRKSTDRKDDKTKFIPVNLHIQVLGAREVSVSNFKALPVQTSTGSSLTEWVTNRKERLQHYSSTSSSDGAKDPRAMRRQMLIADSVFSASSRRIRGIMIDDGTDGSDGGATTPHLSTLKTYDSDDHGQGNSFNASTEHVYYETITVGAPAAHSMGFKDNHGLKHMEEEFKKVSDEKKKIMNDPSSSIASKLEIYRKYVELDLLLSERRQVVYSQALAALSCSILSKLFVLATTSSTIGISEKEAFERKEELDALLDQGFLVEWESLLSTAGSELGMLEDTYDAITFISTCVKVRFEVIPTIGGNDDGKSKRSGNNNVDTIVEESDANAAATHGSMDIPPPPPLESDIDYAEIDESLLPLVSARVHRASYCMKSNEWVDSGDIRASSVYWLLTLRLPESIVRKLPIELQNIMDKSTSSSIETFFIKGTNVVDFSKLNEFSTPFPVQCVLLTQGINEKQTLINSIHFLSISGTQLQEHINNEAVRQLNEYCEKRFKKIKPQPKTNTTDQKAGAGKEESKVQQEIRAELYNASILACAKLNKAAKSQVSSEKNSSILQLTSDLVRWLGGLRIISCKSAKDRTSMSITLEEARMLSIWHHMDPSEVQRVANLTREYGVRLINVNKNTGVPRYAFNTVQRRLLPADYRPPVNTIGSFFARGNVS